VRKKRIMLFLLVYAFFSQVGITIIHLFLLTLFNFPVFSCPNNFACGNYSLESTPVEFYQLDENKMNWGLVPPFRWKG